MAETELSYAGLNSLERAKLAGDVVIERMKTSGFNGDIRRDINWRLFRSRWRV